MDRIMDLMEPLLRIGFPISLAVVAVLCLVDLIQRYRTSRLQFASKHLFILMLIGAHAGSITAFGRLEPSVAQRIGDWPGWLSAPMGFLVLLYVFGPAALLVLYGCHEASEGRPYYILVFLLYLLAMNSLSSLTL